MSILHRRRKIVARLKARNAEVAVSTSSSSSSTAPARQMKKRTAKKRARK